MDAADFNLSPIGFFRCGQRYRFETPRQGAFADNSGVIILNDDQRLVDACRDLEGVERIWIIFGFHLNATWKSFVQPPVSPGGKKISLFATRSPHRPNRLGLSCVILDKIEKNSLYIRNFDLLDNTPVFDIKPYIPAADSFPDSRVPWLDDVKLDTCKLIYSEEALARIQFIVQQGGPDLKNFCDVQLVSDPFNSARKRVVALGGKQWSIGCRTWQIFFEQKEHNVLEIKNIKSNYPAEELMQTVDRYGDKKLHRDFTAVFEL